VNLAEYNEQIDTLAAEPCDDLRRPALLQALRDWGKQLEDGL